MSLAIGCDVGATNQRVALIDVARGKILDERKSPSHVDDYRAGVAALCKDIDALCGKRKLPIGVGLAGHLDPTATRIIHAPNLHWRNVPLARDLQRKFSTRVVLENDVRAAARGELAFGALRGVTGSAACVFWGSGIGGAVVASGQVIRGTLALAGEVGHLTYKVGGRLCACDKRGCCEAYCGGHVLDAAAQKLFKRKDVSARELFASREVKAKAIVNGAKAAAGFLLGQVIQLLDPEHVVLGGSLGEALFSQMAHEVKPYLLPARKGKMSLVRTKLGDNAGIFGAAHFARFAVR